MVRESLAAMVILWLAPGAWAQDSSASLVLTPRGATRASVTPASAPPLRLTVPAETEVSAQLLSGIHTQVSQVDDPVTAVLLQPVYVNGQVALPLGTLLDGHITRIKPAGRLNRPAQLALRFDQITLPDGQAKPITGLLSSLDNSPSSKTQFDPEGYLEGARRRVWRRALLGGLVGTGVLGTLRAAVVGSTALACLAPASGAAIVGYAALWPRGNDVNLPPETRCRIRLNNPLVVQASS